MQHIPVLHSEVITLLDPQEGEVLLDVTLGLGGHSALFLNKIGKSGKLYAIEADQENLNIAESNLNEFRDQIDLRCDNFCNIAQMNFPPADIVFADLGLSSPHLDDPQRGFSFREDAPLDMRFDRTNGIPASQLIAQLDEQGLAEIFWTYGELKSGRKIAKAIKASEKIRTTFELKECIEKAIGFHAKDMLPQVFQALRIAVNDEMGSLEILLREGPKLLKPGGRMGVISFHSLEDRMVKQVFKTLATPKIDPVTGAISKEAEFEVVTKKPVGPSDEEVVQNPRARSAKLRVLKVKS
ncbi:MAG: 16S rRNA (cytosine(1402)-N(4))-methyltransferase RsmH [Kiritimatiellales bacterium]|nr:16S rRNA (cytosine(1402)-N(4))-methyltransferase RsmH [Kiritimatiellales bacterium]